MEESLRLCRGSADRAGHQVVYLPVEVVVGLEPDGIEDSFILQVLIHIRRGEGCVPPEVELLVHLPVSLDDGLQELFPAIGGVDVSGSQYRPFTVTVVVEAEQRAVSYTHLRAHETRHDLVCRLLLEKKKNKNKKYN